MTQAYLQAPRVQGEDVSTTQGWEYSRVLSRAGSWWAYHCRVSASRGRLWGYTYSFVTHRSWLIGDVDAQNARRIQ